MITHSFQVSGRQRVFLFSPKNAFEGLYPFPVHHPYDKYSMVDLEKVDSDMWPMSRKVGKLQNDVIFKIYSYFGAPGEEIHCCN